MTTFVRYVLLGSLLLALVGYFLPWFTWTNRTTLVYSDHFKKGLVGLPDDMQPANEYDARIGLAPVPRGLSLSDFDSELSQNVMARFGDVMPAYHFGPRTTTLGRWSYLASWLALVAAFACIVQRPRVAFVATLLAVGTLIVALVSEAHLGRYLGHEQLEKESELPGQFSFTFDMEYRTTPWFWAVMACLIIALLGTLVLATQKRPTIA